MPSTHVLQAGAQRRPRHDPRRLQPQGVRDDRERVCRDSRPVRRGRQGLSFPHVRVWGGDASRARERERNAHVSQKHVHTHVSHTLCHSYGSVHVSLCCLLLSILAPGLLWRCASSPTPPTRVAGRETREPRDDTSPRVPPLPSGSPRSRKIYILNTKSHWDATTIIRSRATIPARSHEQFPTAQGSLNSRCQTPAPPASPA